MSSGRALSVMKPERGVPMETKPDLKGNKREDLEALFHKHGCTDFKWIEPGRIVISQWVRMKCMFGCERYGQRASCPPNMPSVPECEKFFQEYDDAVVFHFAKKVTKVEDRYAWERKANVGLSKLEREAFLSGYEKAFLLFMGICRMCDECPAPKEKCREPEFARPTPEAMAVDVFATAREVGYPIEVLSDYSQKMNRYAFLLIE